MIGFGFDYHPFFTLVALDILDRRFYSDLYCCYFIGILFDHLLDRMNVTLMDRVSCNLSYNFILSTSIDFLYFAVSRHRTETHLIYLFKRYG